MKKNVLIIIIIGTYIVVGSISLINGQLKGDEKKYHYPLVEKFMNEFPKFDFKENYSSASTPIPYIITGTLGQIIPLNVYTLRIITIFFSILTLFIFYNILNHLNITTKEEMTLFLLFHPYYLVNSSVFYMSIWGMFFGLFSVYIYLKAKTMAHYFIAGLLSVLAIMSRQFYLFLPAAFFCYWIWKRLSKKNTVSFTCFITLMLPHLIPIAFFLYWGGISSPGFRINEIGLKPMNLVFMIIMVGFYFSWSLIVQFQLKRTDFFILVFIPLFFLFLPKWSVYYSGKTISGLIMHFSDLAKNIIGYGDIIFLLIFFLLGLLIAKIKLTDFRSFKYYDFLFLFVIVFFSIIISFKLRSGERMFLALLPFLLIWLSSLFNRKNIRIALFVMPFLSLFYLFYYHFLN